MAKQSFTPSSLIAARHAIRLRGAKQVLRFEDKTVARRNIASSPTAPRVGLEEG